MPVIINDIVRMFNNLAIGNDHDSLFSFRCHEIRNISTTLSDKANKQCEKMWQELSRLQPVSPGQGILPVIRDISSLPALSSPRGEGMAKKITRAGVLALLSAHTKDSGMLHRVDNAVNRVMQQLLPWASAHAQQYSASGKPADVAGRPGSLPENIDTNRLSQQLDEFLLRTNLSLDKNQRQQLMASLSGTEIIFITPPAAENSRQERAHADEMKTRIMLYQVSLRDQRLADGSVGARMVGWGEKQNKNSYALFLQGHQSGSRAHFLASGTMALLGKFSQTLGELFRGEILDPEPGESSGERWLRLASNVVMPPEMAAGKAFRFRLTPAIKPVLALPGTLITHSTSGLTLQSVLQTKIAGMRWHLFPQGGQLATAVPVGSSAVTGRMATRNPRNNKWRIENMPGEYRFTQSSTPGFFVKNSDGYFAVTPSLDDGTMRLSDGQKIYFNQHTQQWAPFYAGNTHLHARSLAVIPEAAMTAEPGRQGVLTTRSGSERRVWQTQQGKYYLEVRSQADNPGSAKIDYIEGWPEGDFFTVRGSEDAPSPQLPVLKWQPSTSRWDIATSPFSQLTAAEGKIDAGWLRKDVAPQALTPVAGRPGLYNLEHRYLLRWRAEAEGDMSYLALVPTEHPARYHPEQAGADDMRFHFDENQQQWQFVALEHKAFADVPDALKVQPDNPFSASYALPGYQLTYRSRGEIFIHTGSDKQGAAQYIAVKQNEVNPDLFTLPLENNDGTDSEWLFRYQRDEEVYELVEKRLCQRSKRADEESCAGPSWITDGEKSWLALHPQRDNESKVDYARRLFNYPPNRPSDNAIAFHTGIDRQTLLSSLHQLPPRQPQPPISQIKRPAQQGIETGAEESQSGGSKWGRKKINKAAMRNWEQQIVIHQEPGETALDYAVRVYDDSLTVMKFADIAKMAGVDEFTLSNRLSELWLEKRTLRDEEKQWLRNYPRQQGEGDTAYAVRLLGLREEQLADGTLVSGTVDKNSITSFARATLQSVMVTLRERNKLWLHSHPRLTEESAAPTDDFESWQQKSILFARRLLQQRDEPPKAMLVSIKDIATYAGIEPHFLRQKLETEKASWLEDIPRLPDEETDSDQDGLIIQHKNQRYARRLAEQREQQQMSWLISNKEIAAHARVTVNALRETLQPEFSASLPLPIKPDPDSGIVTDNRLLRSQWSDFRALLVDANDLSRSLTKELIASPVSAKPTFKPQGRPGTEWTKRWEKFSAQAQALVDSDGASQAAFTRDNLKVVYDEQQPQVGLQVQAKRTIPASTFIGGYSGVWHPTDESLTTEYRKMGSEKVLTYLWGTNTEGSVSGLQNANKLALINTASLRGLPALGENNLAIGYINDILPFYYTTREIKENEQLLVDYGDNYNPKYLLQKTVDNDKFTVIARSEQKYFVIHDWNNGYQVFSPDGINSPVPKGSIAYHLKERMGDRGIIRYDVMAKKGRKNSVIKISDNENIYFALATAISNGGGEDIIQENVSRMKQAVVAAHPEDALNIKLEQPDDRR